MEALYRDALSLVAPSILLKVELADGRRPSVRRRPNHVALPYYVPWLPRDDATRLTTKRLSVCLEASSHTSKGKANKLGNKLARVLRTHPGAMVRLVEPKRMTRSLLCGSRRRMRTCHFCLVPRGITPSSRRFYEAIAAKCIPVLLSDSFVLPYEGDANAASARATGSGGLLPPRAIDSFVLRVPEASVDELPKLLDGAMARHEEMLRASQA